LILDKNYMQVISGPWRGWQETVEYRTDAKRGRICRESSWQSGAVPAVGANLA